MDNTTTHYKHYKGVVARYLAYRKFGFINYSEGEIFYHELDVVDGSTLKRGDHVLFELGTFRGREKAVRVQRLMFGGVR